MVILGQKTSGGLAPLALDDQGRLLVSMNGGGGDVDFASITGAPTDNAALAAALASAGVITIQWYNSEGANALAGSFHGVQNWDGSGWIVGVCLTDIPDNTEGVLAVTGRYPAPKNAGEFNVGKYVRWNITQQHFVWDDTPVGATNYAASFAETPDIEFYVALTGQWAPNAFYEAG